MRNPNAISFEIESYQIHIIHANAVRIEITSIAIEVDEKSVTVLGARLNQFRVVLLKFLSSFDVLFFNVIPQSLSSFVNLCLALGHFLSYSV